MFIMINDAGKNYVAVSNREYMLNMSEEDMLLDENLTIWKITGRKGWSVVCARFNPTTDLLRYEKGLFEKEITYQSLLRYTVPRMKQLFSERGLIKDRYWYNEALIVSKDKAYIIDGYFCVREVVDFDLAHIRAEVMRGSLELNKHLPTRTRIREAVKAMEDARGRKQYPLLFIDISTGKREVWRAHEDAVKKDRQGKV